MEHKTGIGRERGFKVYLLVVNEEDGQFDITEVYRWLS